MNVIESIEQQQLKEGQPTFRPGDALRIHFRIVEGDKERTQVFQGTVIAIKGGQSLSPTITVRKVSSGVGVELILPLNSSQIDKIEFVKRTRSRRAKLYYVRDKSVKVLSKKLKEVMLKAKKGIVEEAAPEAVEEKSEEKVEEVKAPAEISETENKETAKE